MSIPVESTAKLKEIAGMAPSLLLHCHKCNTPASHHSPDNKYPWAMKLLCSSCNVTWWVCKECMYQRIHITTNIQASRHHRTKHKVSITSSQPPTNPPTAPVASIPPNLEEVLKASSGRKANHTYFLASANGIGQQQIISKAIGQNISTNFYVQDLDMMLSLTHFMLSLSRTQREEFASVLNATTASTVRRITQTSSLPISIPVPTTKQQLRSIFSEGKKAIIPNLPHPQVRVVADHAYTLPSECLADYLGHASPPKKQSSIHSLKQTLGQSPLAKTILQSNAQKDCNTFFFSIWSDDFEPNYSKTNRGSVWIMTLTIHLPSNDAVTMREVYPIAIGPKSTKKNNVNHDEVVSILLNDIKKMSCTESMQVYDATSGTIKQVSAHLLCIVQDQPERRGFCNLLTGGIGPHGRFGFAVDLIQIADKLPPCDNCRNYLFDSETSWMPRNCDKCFCFMQMPEEIQYEPENYFPPDKLNKNGLLYCEELSFPFLVDCVRTTHQKIVLGEWTKQQSDQYLHRYCINEDFRKKILDHAINGLTLKNLNLTTAEEGASLASMETDHPEWFTPCPSPPIWDSGISMHQLAEPCMHLLFLGIQKNLTSDLKDWSTLRGKYQFMKKELESRSRLVESFHLSWCKMEPYVGEKLGGWVSENYLALTRLIPWMYEFMEDVDWDEPIPTPEDKPVSRWNVTECKTFLKIRGLIEEGTAGELRRLVNANKDLPVLPTPGGNISTVRQMLLSFWLMTSHLMGMKEVTTEEVRIVERNTRVFLYTSSVYDESYPNTHPRWISRYNYQCLLNIPSQIELLGPIRNRWEGGLGGEGFLRRVKPLLRPGRKNWQKNTLHRILRDKSCRVLLSKNKTMDENPDEEQNQKQNNASGNFKIYPTHSYLCDELKEGCVISCFGFQDQDGNVSIGSSYLEYQSKKVVRFKVDESENSYHFGAYYFRIEMEDCVESDNLADPLDIQFFGLLLPKRISGGRSFYTIVTSEWCSWDKNATVLPPHKYTKITDIVSDSLQIT